MSELNHAELMSKFIELQQKIENMQSSQSVILKNLSQNIRIPLNGIIGMIDVMKMTTISDEQSEYLDIINKYGENLIVIVNDILDYSKIITNELELEKRFVSSQHLFQKIEQAYRMRIEGKGLKFDVSIDPQTPSQIFCDESRIHQIISNLINNAIKFTREGKIEFAVKIINQNHEIEDCVMRFSVSDTGFGLTSSKQKQISKELEKDSANIIIKTDGIGLGLSNSQALLRKMNSKIEFNSSENNGSDFWFDLKIPSKKSKFTLPNLSHLEGTHKLKILLVEDNILNQKFAIATLVKHGHHVVLAENGKIAFEKYQQHPFDLILMDVQMPIMDGVLATLKIRKFEEENRVKKPIKIVAVTAYAMDRDREKCLNAGMDKFLAKPFKPDQLIEIIDNIDFN
jgi:CheY-like chemotaxis protein/nitrogen-specific signal transduction histidine kinase